MKTYSVCLKCEPSRSFHAVRAANSLDIDVDKKSTHEFSVTCDLDAPYSVGLILGASGSGKSTLARRIFGDDCFKTFLDDKTAVIDQFPEGMSYDDRATALNGIGLTSVPCWIKPAGTLSNGQKARAEAALALCLGDSHRLVIDEWTSVVDRTVAKVMSHCVQKYARKNGKSVVLVACHSDIIEWLDPDWIIDCNSQRFIDRRSLRPAREEKLLFEVREVTGHAWARFSKYHYLNAGRVGGRCLHFGLFHNDEQIGYACLVNYVPWTDKTKPMMMHVSRVVVHPDFAGMGLGVKLSDAVAREGVKLGYRVLIKMSSTPMYKSMSKSSLWKFMKVDRQIGRMKSGAIRHHANNRTARTASQTGGFRENVKTYTFEFVGKS